jgi:hypothetical protein
VRRPALEARLDGRVLSWGGGQYCTDSIGQRAQAPVDRGAIIRCPEPHLYCPKEMQSVPEREDTQRACSPIGPHGRTGTMPRMRRGDFDPTDRAYERARRRAPHVRVQAMPRATSIHRRSRERNYSCDAPLAGRSPTAPPAIEPLGGEPRLPTGRGSLSEPPVAGARRGKFNLVARSRQGPVAGP